MAALLRQSDFRSVQNLLFCYLCGRDFVAGDRFTIADITALSAIDVAAPMANFQIAPALVNLTRWHQAVSSRPSAKV